MSKLKMALAAAVVALSAGAANAAVFYATTYKDYKQGDCSRPAECVASRYNPTNALGAPNKSFVSLGLGGELTLGFSRTFGGNDSITAWEVTYSANDPKNRHLEAVDVYAVLGGSQTYLGRVTNAAGPQAVQATGAFEYIRLVDVSRIQFGNTTSFDGFDVDAVSIAAVPLPAAGLMLLSGLGGLAALRRRKKAKA